jgi:predicted nucleic acid-binding protein
MITLSAHLASSSSCRLTKARSRSQGLTVTAADAAIAGAALIHELTLTTDNVKDFPMRQLALYPLPVA